MCIRLENVTRVNGWATGAPHVVLRDVTFEFPKGKSFAVLGARGSGKSTLIRLLAGAIEPSTGRIQRSGHVSHPVGTLGWLNRYMSGRENACFLARLYGFDPKPIIRFVAQTSDLGSNFDQPIATYSGEKRARFAFALSYAMPFDTFIADEALVGGPAGFRELCKDLVRARQQSSSFILATRSPALARLFCDAAAVLHEGVIEPCESVTHAVARLAEINSAGAGRDVVEGPDGPPGDDDWVTGGFDGTA